MVPRTIPVDRARVGTTRLGPKDWMRAADAHERFKDLLDVKPRAKARYEAVLEEIHAR